MRKILVKEYARELGVSDQMVRTMVDNKKLRGDRISPRKMFVYVPETQQEEAQEQALLSGVSPNKANLAQDKPTDPELEKLDRELVELEKTEELVDRKTQLAEKQLRLKTNIGWDEYQEKLRELRDAEAKLLSDREQLDRDRLALQERDNGLDEMERSLRNSLRVMESWWDKAGGCVLDIIEAVQAIQHESTYDKSNPQAYQPKGGVRGLGVHPPEKTLLIGNALKDRWSEVFKVLVKIARIPRPDFSIDVHRSDVELLDDGQYEDADEREPDELDLTEVEQQVDEDVEEVEADIPDVGANIVRKGKGKGKK